MIRTKKQALQEAQRRWGRHAAVRDRGPKFPCRVPLYDTQRRIKGHREVRRYSVGRVEHGMFFGVRGEGNSWQEAFANAQT